MSSFSTDFQTISGGATWSASKKEDATVSSSPDAARPEAEYRLRNNKIEIRTGARVTRARGFWADLSRKAARPMSEPKLSKLDGTREIHRLQHDFDKAVDTLVEDLANGDATPKSVSEKLQRISKAGESLQKFASPQKRKEMDQLLQQRFLVNLREAVDVVIADAVKRGDFSKVNRLSRGMEQGGMLTAMRDALTFYSLPEKEQKQALDADKANLQKKNIYDSAWFRDGNAPNPMHTPIYWEDPTLLEGKDGRNQPPTFGQTLSFEFERGPDGSYDAFEGAAAKRHAFGQRMVKLMQAELSQVDSKASEAERNAKEAKAQAAAVQRTEIEMTRITKSGISFEPTPAPSDLTREIETRMNEQALDMLDEEKNSQAYYQDESHPNHGICRGMERDFGRSEIFYDGQQLSQRQNEEGAIQSQKQAKSTLLEAGVPPKDLKFITAVVNQGLFGGFGQMVSEQSVARAMSNDDTPPDVFSFQAGDSGESARKAPKPDQGMRLEIVPDQSEPGKYRVTARMRKPMGSLAGAIQGKFGYEYKGLNADPDKSWYEYEIRMTIDANTPDAPVKLTQPPTYGFHFHPGPE